MVRNWYFTPIMIIYSQMFVCVCVCVRVCVCVCMYVCMSTENTEFFKRFLRLYIIIKLLIKNRLNKFFITLKRNSFKISSQIWRLSKVRTGWPYR